MKTEATACILCSRNCGLLVDHADGKFVRIRGDEQHPVSRGYLCQKPTRLAHYQEHADRITQPLQRQPDGSFVPVTWELALSDIARRLVAIREAGAYGRSMASTYNARPLACEVFVSGGRVAEVFIAETKGYFDAGLTPESLAENWDAVTEQEGYAVPAKG